MPVIITGLLSSSCLEAGYATTTDTRLRLTTYPVSVGMKLIGSRTYRSIKTNSCQKMGAIYRLSTAVLSYLLLAHRVNGQREGDLDESVEVAANPAAEATRATSNTYYNNMSDRLRLVGNEESQSTLSSESPSLALSTLSPAETSDTSTSPSQTQTFQPSELPSPVLSQSPSDISMEQGSDALSTLPSLAPKAPLSDASPPSNRSNATGLTVPSFLPSEAPSFAPSDAPPATPTSDASSSPSGSPSSTPSSLPTGDVSIGPSTDPSKSPYSIPSNYPSNIPSTSPSTIFTREPSTIQNSIPGPIPSSSPSRAPLYTKEKGTDSPDSDTERDNGVFFSPKGARQEESFLVIGGVDAAVGEYPYFVTLLGDDTPFCGGTLIHPRIVLTAAHCNVDAAGDFTIIPQFIGSQVRVGAVDLTGTADGSELAQVVRQILHPNPTVNANQAVIRNDFMILELAVDVVVDTNIELRLSRDPTNMAPGTELRIIGLGGASPTGQRPMVLQQSDVFAISDTFCGQPFPEQNLCAGVNDFYTTPTNVCPGDSGGPIMKVEGDVHIQVGLTSFGPGSCDGSNINVFAQIPNNDDGFGWIHKTVCSDLGYTDATFCGGNICENSDCDCNAGYDCQCDVLGSDDDDDSGDDERMTSRRFLSDYAKQMQQHQDEHHESLFVYEFASIAKSSLSSSSSHRPDSKDRRRRIKSSKDSTESSKDRKECKSVKKCKGGVPSKCLDNGDLSGEGQDTINNFLLTR